MCSGIFYTQGVEVMDEFVREGPQREGAQHALPSRHPLVVSPQQPYLDNPPPLASGAGGGYHRPSSPPAQGGFHSPQDPYPREAWGARDANALPPPYAAMGRTQSVGGGVWEGHSPGQGAGWFTDAPPLQQWRDQQREIQVSANTLAT